MCEQVWSCFVINQTKLAVIIKLTYVRSKCLDVFSYRGSIHYLGLNWEEKMSDTVPIKCFSSSFSPAFINFAHTTGNTL